MKILVNATTLVVGGGIQIGVSFIEEAVKISGFQLKFIVSTGIYENISDELKNKFDIIHTKISPANPLKGKKTAKEILEIEKEFQPDLVYSIGFPSYIRFNAPEVGRYTNPWEINSKPLPWHLYPSFKQKVKIWLGIQYRIFWAKRAAYIETQTQDAANGIERRVRFPRQKIKVIPNSPNEIFIKTGREITKEEIEERKNIVFCIAAAYPHKNLEIIPKVAKILKDKLNNPPTFILTLPPENDIWNKIQVDSRNLNVSELIENVGKLKLSECVKYYRNAKLLFLPTLMEIFSASYVEAMAMKVPIITTDLNFAHDNCGNAALYYNAYDETEAASKIIRLLEDKDLYFSQIQNGLEKLQSYPSLSEKYNILFNWFREIKKENVRK